MNDAIDTRLRDQVRASSIETRAAIFEDLVRELMQTEADSRTMPIETARGELLGHFVRPQLQTTGAVPELTPEEEVEYQRRLDSLDDTLAVDEAIRRLRAAAPVGTR